MNYIIPEIIETERLRLRMFREPDWKDLYDFFSDPDCVAYTIGKPLTQHETWQKMASFIGHWQLRGYGPYAIEEKQTTKVAGFAGPYFPLDWPEPEIQWSLSKQFWSKGYAGEVVKAIKPMLVANLPGVSFISIIHPGNSGSIKLAEKINTRFEKEYYFRDITWHIYRHI